MHALADFIKEYTSTTGTGLSLTLSGAVPGYARFSDASNITNNTTVYYRIKNGSNREHGVGTWKTGNILERTTPVVTLVAGTLDDSSPAKIDLVGQSEVIIATTSKIFSDIFAIPSAIGSTTPAAGTFTTLTANDNAIVGDTTFSSVALSTTISAKIAVSSATYTDTATAISGTVAHGTIVSIDNPAIAATNTTVTYTNASTLYIDGAPTNGTNVTITNPYAVYVADGKTHLGGAVNIVGDVSVSKTITAPATTGAQTINKTAGSVNFAAAASSLVVTNSLATADSLIFLQLHGAADATMTAVTYTTTSGSFTILANAAATAETRVDFLVVN